LTPTDILREVSPRVALHTQHGSRSSAVLDLARIVAAFAVCAGHARNVWFVSHPELERSGGIGDVAAWAFYALTRYG
jgi:hypothetical protein